MLMKQGLSRDEALGCSYEEMWVRTRQQMYEDRRDALADFMLRIQTMPLGDPKESQKALRSLQTQIDALETSFYKDIELA